MRSLRSGDMGGRTPEADTKPSSAYLPFDRALGSHDIGKTPDVDNLGEIAKRCLTGQDVTGRAPYTTHNTSPLIRLGVSIRAFLHVNSRITCDRQHASQSYGQGPIEYMV